MNLNDEEAVGQWPFLSVPYIQKQAQDPRLWSNLINKLLGTKITAHVFVAANPRQKETYTLVFPKDDAPSRR